MAMTAEEILEEARQLGPAERARIAEFLWLSVDDATQAERDAAWSAELRRRIDDVETGRAQPRPVEEVIERLRRRAAK